MRLSTFAKEQFRPMLFKGRFLRALLKARAPTFAKNRLPRVAFVVGCGRSGTTVLGDLLATHSDVSYLFEPLHFWRAVLPCVDVNSRDTRSIGRLFLSAEDYDEKQKRYFERSIRREARGRPLLVEKTPHNALRIEWLEQLYKDAKYVHIVRDGLEVVRSIQSLSSDTSYRIGGIPTFNRWWGRNEVKWSVLRREGKSRGYYADEVDSLESYEQRAAYEWLVSLHEIERTRLLLGARLLEVRLVDLTTNTREVATRIANFLELPLTASASARMASVIRRESKPTMTRDLVIPSRMHSQFKTFQRHYGFL